jgi:hypothetical protein
VDKIAYHYHRRAGGTFHSCRLDADGGNKKGLGDYGRCKCLPCCGMCDNNIIPVVGTLPTTVTFDLSLVDYA